jgi:hypothetical protein
MTLEMNNDVSPHPRLPQRWVQALIGERAGFLAFLAPFDALAIFGIVVTLIADISGELRTLLVLNTGLLMAGLTWLIVWVIRNPLDGPAPPPYCPASSATAEASRSAPSAPKTK